MGIHGGSGNGETGMNYGELKAHNQLHDGHQILNSLSRKTGDRIKKFLAHDGKSSSINLTLTEVVLVFETINDFYELADKAEQRDLLVTNKAVYCLKTKQSFWSKFKGLFSSNVFMRRMTKIDSIDSISLSINGPECLLHVFGEYDYRFSSPGRNKILMAIINAYFAATTNTTFKFFFHQEALLKPYCTTRKM